MFSLINMILTIFVLLRVYKYDKFYMITYDMRIKETGDVRDFKKRDNKKGN